MRALLFCIFLVLVFQSRSFGQLTFDGRVVNGSCTDLKFDELVRTLEASSDYYFYYNKAATLFLSGICMKHRGVTHHLG